MQMMSASARGAGLLLALVCVLSACGAAATPSSTGVSSTVTPSPPVPGVVLSGPASAPSESDEMISPQPPPLVVASDAGAAAYDPYTYCWSARGVGVCADGMPALDDRVRVAGSMHLEFPVDGWTLTASRRLDRDGTDTAPVALRRRDDTIWMVAEPLPTGRHVLEVSGRGPEGDAFWAIPVEVTTADDVGNH